MSSSPAPSTKIQNLTADTSGISDADGLGPFSYQWLRNGTNIAGATSSTYTPGDLDVGTNISVVVSYTDGQGQAESITTTSVTVTAQDQLASRSLTDGTEYTSSAYAGSSMDDSGSYYEDWDNADDHGSNDLEYVRAAVTESDALLENVNDVDLTPTPANDLATGDLSVILEAPAAGEVEAAQELNEALQQEAERFEQDRKQLIETLDEVSEFLRCG